MWGDGMTTPKRIDLTQEQTDSLLLRVKTNALEEGDYEIIEAIIDTLRFLSQAYEDKTVSIKRLLRMIFGARTEKTKDVLGGDDEPESSAENPDGSFKEANTTGNDASGCNEANKEDTEKKTRKGHGRNGARCTL